MGTRSKVAMLPASVRAELDRRIVEGAFSGYQALAEWLQARGYRIGDDSVQRYGARLRRQLDAINLARQQAQALAAAGKGVGDTADSLTAITVQLILQQVLSILLQAAQPDTSSQTDNLDGETKTLDLRDLQRLTRIIVDLNRVTNGRHQRAGQSSASTRQALTDRPAAEPKHKYGAAAIYQAICDAGLASDRRPPSPAPPPPKPGATTADTVAPAEAQQSSSETIQPELTAVPRTYPHNRLHRVPLNNVAHQKLVAHPRPPIGTGAPDSQPENKDEPPECPNPSDSGRPRRSS